MRMALFVLIWLWSPAAQAVFINFDSDLAGHTTLAGPVGNSYAALGVGFEGGQFEICTFPGCPSTGYFAYETGGMTLHFARPVSDLSFVLVTYSSAFVEAFDPSGLSLGRALYSTTEPFASIGFGPALIGRLVLAYGGGSQSAYGIDDLTFTPVSEPGPFAVISIGLVACWRFGRRVRSLSEAERIQRSHRAG